MTGMTVSERVEYGKNRILFAAEIIEPGCAITLDELTEYLREHDTPSLSVLFDRALKVIAENAL